MDYRHNNPYTDQGRPASFSRPDGNALATAAMLMGILAAVLCSTLTVYPTFVLGSLSIVMALLSKGQAARTDTKARIGMTGAIIGIVFNCLLIAATVKAVYANPEVLEEAYDLFEDRYGISYEEMLDSVIYGGDISAPQ